MQPRASILALLPALALGCGQCSFGEGPPPCEGWPPAAPAPMVAPAAGAVGDDFVVTFEPVPGATAYEAEVSVLPYQTWAPLTADASGVVFQPAAAGYYVVRVRATNGECAPTDWGMTSEFEARMTWTMMPTPPWTPRVNQEALVFMDQVWMLGGFTDVESSDEIWTSTDGVAWNPVVPTTPHWSGRGSHEAVVFDDRLWVLGGLGDTGEFDDVWWSGDGLAWYSVPNMGRWSARWGHEVVAFNGELWLFGGAHRIGPMSGDYAAYADIWRSPDGVTWTMETSAAPWPARSSHTVIEFEGRLWLMGGADAAAITPYDDVWSSADGSVWNYEATGPHWGGRYGPEAFLFDDRLWIASGAQTDYVEWGDVWYSTDGLNWVEAATTGLQWPPRRFFTATVFGGQVWFMAGWNQFVGRTNDVWIGP